MSFSYGFLELAQEEYESAVTWYAERSIKAAEGFIAAVENTLGLICAHPERWRNEYRHFRELKLKRYPYVLVYTFEKAQGFVLIVAVFHTSRHPHKKYRNT